MTNLSNNQMLEIQRRILWAQAISQLVSIGATFPNDPETAQLYKQMIDVFIKNTQDLVL